jgi:hypothetical protein
MKTIPMLEDPDALNDDPTVGSVDWRDSPETVLKTVDALLAPHGLEIVVSDTRTDEYKFRIETRR